MTEKNILVIKAAANLASFGKTMTFKNTKYLNSKLALSHRGS